MESKLKFGLVGCGSIGKRHAEIINELGILVAVCDTEIVKLTEFTTKYNCKGYESYEVMLQNAGDIQVMVICTPNYLHATQSIKALSNGLHVLCEKPMALTTEDCISMQNCAKVNNRLLKVVKQNRYNGPVKQLKRIIDERNLGELVSFNMNLVWARNDVYYANTWRGKIKEDGGILFTQFSHFIDILIWLFGEIETFEAMGANQLHKHNTEYEDTIIIIAKTKAGVLGSIHASTNAYNINAEGSLMVIGSTGTIKIGGNYLNKLEYENTFRKELFIEERVHYSANIYGAYEGSKSSHPEVYHSFIQQIQRHVYSDAELNDSAATVSFIENTYKKLRFNLH